MRICFLRFISLDTTIGYTETLDLINYMSSKGHKIFFIIIKSSKTANPRDYFDENVKIYEIPALKIDFGKKIISKTINFFIYTLFSIFLLIKLQIKEKLDIIHFYPETTIPIFILSKFFKKIRFVLDLRKPTLIQSRELTDIQSEELELNRKLIPIIINFYTILEKMSLFSADGIISITEGVQNYIKMKLTMYKIVIEESMILPCSVNLKIFKKGIKSSTDFKNTINIKEDDRVLLYLGSVSVGREFQKVLKILGDILKDKKHIKFLILGKIDPKLNNLIDELKLRPYVIVKYVPHHLIADYIKIADICLSYIPDTPTFRYSCPLKVLEYMAMEKPVVATNIDAHRNLIKNEFKNI